MIRQIFDVESYWRVIVFYNADYDSFDEIWKSLRRAGASERIIRLIYQTMGSGKAKAVTYNSIEKHMSIVLFNRHRNQTDYINSIVHEAEHIKQAMLEAYRVEDSGEKPAYTIGYLVGRMWKTFFRIYN
jgi:hypothetical protein